MADLAHSVGSDLMISSTGDLAVVDLTKWTQQRILRRLLTNAGDYIWQLNYGAGLPGMIGATASAQQIAAVIRRQIGLEIAVSRNPEPKVLLQIEQMETIFATVTYQDAQTATSQTLSVPRPD